MPLDGPLRSVVTSLGYFSQFCDVIGLICTGPKALIALIIRNSEAFTGDLRTISSGLCKMLTVQLSPILAAGADISGDVIHTHQGAE